MHIFAEDAVAAADIVEFCSHGDIADLHVCLAQQLYLPAGIWRDFADVREYAGEQVLICETPMKRIPVFESV